MQLEKKDAKSVHKIIVYLVAFSYLFLVTVPYWLSWEVTGQGLCLSARFVYDFLADDGVDLFLCFATSGCLVSELRAQIW